MIVRLVARALAGSDHGEAASTRPVDVLAHERGLIAPSEAVHHAGRFRFAREQGSRKRIGLHVHHDDVLSMRDRLQSMADASRSNPGRLDDHLDLGEGDQNANVAGYQRAAGGMGSGERRSRNGLVFPSCAAKLVSGARHVEVGDGNDVHAARQPGLGQKHRAELACANEADGHRTSRRFALEQHPMEIHASLRSGIGRGRPIAQHCAGRARWAT